MLLFVMIISLFKKKDIDYYEGYIDEHDVDHYEGYVPEHDCTDSDIVYMGDDDPMYDYDDYVTEKDAIEGPRR